MDESDHVEVPAWISPGTKVLVETGGVYRNAVVARVTRTLVVLEDGSRFTLRGLEKRGRTWDPNSYLRDPADREVKSAVRAQNKKTWRARTAVSVTNLLTEWRSTGDDNKAREAIAELTAALEKIEAHH